MKQGWEIKKLGEVVSVKSGKSIDANQINNETALYPCYGGNGIRGFVNDFNYEGCYPLIGRVGALCGNVHLAKGKFYATEHALIVDIKSNKINPEWLTYYLSSLNLRKIAKGVAQPVIAAKEVSKVSIHIPPLPEQEKIVSELDCLSGLIDKKRQQLKELDALAQSIFYEMFGNPVENERGWEVKKLGEMCKVGDGLHGTPTYDNNGTVAFINGTNLIDGRIVITEKTLFVNEAEAIKYRIGMDSNTVLLSINGTLGKTAIYRHENVVLGKSACYCNTNKELLNVVFVEKLMRTDCFRAFLEENSSKSTIKNVGLKAIRDYKIILPPLPLQQTFAQKVEAIEKQKELIKQSIIEAETLLASRMQYYFEEG